ncbi:cytochrome P450 [Actinophytocola glycyrrhizae]|uniref:Cytochrome P450 n=1 Tax=Actinophytocola glycyrrhizae TaxID=2044873 RepID=A0ABV9S7Z3_9PSEU
MSTPANGTSISPDIPFLDVVDQEFHFDAPEVVEAQERSWYANSPIGTLVLRYAEARDLLRDPRLEHNGKRYLEMSGVVAGPIHDWFVPMIVNQDGEDHRRLRGLVNKAFTPRMIDGLRPFIRAKANELTDHLASVDVCEFVEEFGNPLPLAVMCELLGVPAEDYDTFRVWTADVGLVFSLAHGGDIPRRVENALVGLNGYVDALMADKSAAPADDLISALVAAQRADNGRVSMEELRNLIVTLVFAAHDTTRHQLGNAMVAFAAHPGQWRLLGSRPELAAQATDEVIRWIPSAATVYRFAAADFEYRGVRFAKETFFMVCVGIAQRDPRVFRDGATFDISVAGQAPALQFGAGPHHCLGAALARVEVAEVLSVLAGRLGPPVVAAPLSWRPPIGIHGPEPLPLRFGAS